MDFDHLGLNRRGFDELKPVSNLNLIIKVVFEIVQRPNFDKNFDRRYFENECLDFDELGLKRSSFWKPGISSN